MEIKGTAVASIRDFVKSKFPDKYEHWLQALPDGSKQIFGGLIDVSGWYPIYEGGIIPTRVIAEMFYDGNYMEGSLEAGKHSAQKALTGIYKVFVKAYSPAHVAQRATRIFGTYYRPCELVIKNKTDNNATMQITKMTVNDEVIEYRIAGWIYKALEISGAKDITVNFSKSMARGDGVTELEIRWS
jgi:hypothetical protein